MVLLYPGLHPKEIIKKDEGKRLWCLIEENTKGGQDEKKK